MTAVAEFDNDIQALLRRHRRVVARVGFIGVLEVGKYPYRFLHDRIIARWARLLSSDEILRAGRAARLQAGIYRLIEMPRACCRVFATS